MEAVPPVRPAPPVTPAAAAEADVVQEEEENEAGKGLHRICPFQPTRDQSGLSF